MFCPLLSVLFIGTTIEGMQLGDQGQPPGWVQDCMRLAVHALFGQLVMVVVTGLLTSKLTMAEPDKGRSARTIVGMGTTAMQYMGMLTMYVRIAWIIAGFFELAGAN